MDINEARNKMKDYANSTVILPLLNEIEKIQVENDKLKKSLNIILTDFETNFVSSGELVGNPCNILVDNYVIARKAIR